MPSRWSNVGTKSHILSALLVVLSLAAVPATSKAVLSNDVHHAQVHNVAAVASTVLDLNGTWTSGGLPGPRIAAGPTSLTIDMSAYHRPSAQGIIVDNATILVTFPDDATFTGRLEAPDIIRWSNGSEWIKATTVVPDVFELSRGQANSEISSAGLVAKFTGSFVANAWAQSESPQAGTLVARGSTVTVTMHAPPRP